MFYKKSRHVYWYICLQICDFVCGRIGYVVCYGVLWDVFMHNSVCHSYLNEERRKWDPQGTVGVKKKKSESLFTAA